MVEKGSSLKMHHVPASPHGHAADVTPRKGSHHGQTSVGSSRPHGSGGGGGAGPGYAGAAGGGSAPMTPSRTRSALSFGSRDVERQGLATPTYASRSASGLEEDDDARRENITVIVRARPLSEGAHECLAVDENERTVTLQQAASQPGQHTRATNDYSSFRYDHVFGGDCTQERFFNAVGVGACEHFLDGYNVSVMAYGQTGAGKTFTMLGDLEGWQHSGTLQPDKAGLIPRSLDYIFEGVKRHQAAGSHVKVKVSLIEIYNETVVDLLSPELRSLSVREAPTGDGAYADQAVEAAVRDADKCLKLLDVGMRSRTQGSTAMNAQSSRSHLIFSLFMEVVDPNGMETRCGFRLVDLAGSERQKHSRVEGKHLKEAANINQSLTALGKVIMSLAAGSRHVPYRESKLTFLLKTALGGNSRTFVIANVSPGARNEDETLSTLKFASFARKPRTFTKRNGALGLRGGGEDVLALKLEVQALKQQLSLTAGGGGGDQVADLEGLLAESLEREAALLQTLEEERATHRETLEEYEDACQLMEERIGLGGKVGQGGEAALAKARVTRLEAEVMALKKGSTPGEGVEAEVVVLRRQMAATLQRRMGMGGGETMSVEDGDGVEGRLAACMEELEEYRAKYAQALDVIGEQRKHEDEWNELAQQGCEKQEELEEHVHYLQRQLELKNDIITHLNDEHALAAEGEDEVCKVQEEYEGELERMRHKLVDLQLKLEWYEKELASQGVKH